MKDKTIFTGKGISFNYPAQWEKINGTDPVLIVVKDNENDIIVGVSLDNYVSMNIKDLDSVIKEEKDSIRVFEQKILSERELVVDGRRAYEIIVESPSLEKNVITIYLEKQPGFYYTIRRQSRLNAIDVGLDHFYQLVNSFQLIS